MAEYTEFLRIPVTAAGDNTYVQAELKLPTVQMPQLSQWNKMGSKAKAVGLVLHKVEVWIDLSGLAGHVDSYFKWHLSKRSDTAMQTISDPNVIDADIGHIVFDTNGATIRWTSCEKTHYPPVLVSQSSLYFGFHQNTGASRNCYARLHYTLREIDAASYINALVPEQ